jgi:UDP-N-acetylmuramyl pentapeptide synthase
MPCLIELGPAAKEAHQKIGRQIGKTCDLAIITTKDWFIEIKKGALSARIKPGNIIFSENPEEIDKRIKEIIAPDSVILLEGRVSSIIVTRIKGL